MLRDSDGEHEASSAAKEAKLAVHGVRAARAAMARAYVSLGNAVTEAHKSELGAAKAAQEDKKDMHKIVQNAVKAAKDAEGRRIAALRKIRLAQMKKKDAAFQKAYDALRAKQKDIYESADQKMAKQQKKMNEIQMNGPNQAQKLIHTKIETITSPEKLQKLTTKLLDAVKTPSAGTVTRPGDKKPKTLGVAAIGAAVPSHQTIRCSEDTQRRDGHKTR